MAARCLLCALALLSPCARAAPLPVSPLKSDVLGRVVTPANAPVAGASVYWVSFADLQSAGQTTVLAVTQTDSAGRFQFPNALPLYERSLTLLGTGAHTVTAGLPPLLMALAPGFGLTVKSLLAPGRFSDIRLQPATRLRVRLQSGANGQPVPGVRVHLDTLTGAAFAGKDLPLGFLPLPALPDDPFLQISDAQGECDFPNLPQGMLARLGMDDARFARLRPVEANPLLSRSPDTDAPPLTLLPGGALIGRVTFGVSGRPVVDIPVTALAVADGQGSTAVTDAQGVFTIDRLPPGLYRIAADLRSLRLTGGWQAPPSAAARLTAGGRVTGIAVALTRPGLRAAAPSAVRASAAVPAPFSAAPPAPPLSVSDWLNSPALTVIGQRGRIVVLHFWDKRSEPALTALASLQSEFDQNHADGIVVVGIHTARAARADVAAVARQYALTYPLAIDAPDPLFYGQTFRVYGIRAVPSYVVVDRRGNVAYSGRALDAALDTVHSLTLAPAKPAPVKTP